jgi:hypothetical protein
MGHPHLLTRAATSHPDPLRALVHVQSPQRFEWVEQAFALTDILVQIARSVDEIVMALVEDPPPRPQLLIVDFDDLTAAETLQLHFLRGQGWFGRIFGLGKCPLALRSSLGVERVFSTPLPPHVLRTALAPDTHDGPTMRVARVVTG